MIWEEWIKYSQRGVCIDKKGARGLGHIILCECLRDENALGIKL